MFCAASASPIQAGRCASLSRSLGTCLSKPGLRPCIWQGQRPEAPRVLLPWQNQFADQLPSHYHDCFSHNSKATRPAAQTTKPARTNSALLSLRLSLRSLRLVAPVMFPKPSTQRSATALTPAAPAFLWCSFAIVTILPH